jgi:hypothetical protein
MKSIAEAVPVSQPAAMPRTRSKPLLPVRGVMSLLDRDEDAVLRLVEAGSLLWAFDVALDTKHGCSKELRILPASVADFLRGQQSSLEWAEVLRSLLPHDERVILSKDITRILNISSTHFYHLARRRLLVPCSTWRRGRGGCGHFTTESFVAFLRLRRYP